MMTNKKKNFKSSFLFLFIFIFTCSCSINNDIHIVRADIVSLYGHEAYLINDANNEKLQSLKKYKEINDYNEEYFNILL